MTTDHRYREIVDAEGRVEIFSDLGLFYDRLFEYGITNHGLEGWSDHEDGTTISWGPADDGDITYLGADDEGPANDDWIARAYERQTVARPTTQDLILEDLRMER